MINVQDIQNIMGPKDPNHHLIILYFVYDENPLKTLTEPMPQMPDHALKGPIAK